MKFTGTILIALLVIGIVGYNSIYTIDETEQVVITQFGKIVGDAKKEPGLKPKIPFIQKVNYFKKSPTHMSGMIGLQHSQSGLDHLARDNLMVHRWIASLLTCLRKLHRTVTFTLRPLSEALGAK